MTALEPTRILLLGGRSGVGKSTVGWALSDALREAGVNHVHLEGDLLDSYHLDSDADPGVTAMTERNLASVWRNYEALGLRRLIYVNTVSILEPDLVARAVGGTVDITSVLLTADDETIALRLGGRESEASLAAHIERSARASGTLDREAPENVRRVPTSGRTVEAIVRDILRLWPSPRD